MVTIFMPNRRKVDITNMIPAKFVFIGFINFRVDYLNVKCLRRQAHVDANSSHDPLGQGGYRVMKRRF